VASITSSATAQRLRASTVAEVLTFSSEPLLDPCPAAQPRGVDQFHRPPLEGPGDADGVPGEAGFRARQQAFFAEQAVDQRRLAGVGPADHGETQKVRGSFRFARVRPVLVLALRRIGIRQHERAERVGKVGHAAAVRGRDRDRLVEAKAPGLGGGEVAAVALGLVGDQDEGLAVQPQCLGEGLVERGDADLAVDHQEPDVGVVQGPEAQFAQPPREAFLRRLLDAGGVQHGEVQVVQVRLAFEPVAGDAGRIVDDGDAPSDQTVEQGRLAHVGATQDGDGKVHGRWPIGGGASDRRAGCPPNRAGSRYRRR
jgi:hypothetical protein